MASSNQGMKPDIAGVAADLDNAQPLATVHALCRDDPQPGETMDGMLPGQWADKADELGLPPGCPVTPLGVDGPINWFLDPIGQLYAYCKPYGQADTLELCRGRHLWLYWAWPKFKGKGETDFEVDGWKNEKARECFLAAATAKGPWAAVDKVRGRGCWGRLGEPLIMHTGHRVIVDGKQQPPGEIDGFVYPTAPAIEQPAGSAMLLDADPVKIIRQMFRSWAWARPDVDPHLLLGWIGNAFLGPALPWRSAIYLTGDKGAGKSTLQAIIKGLLGNWLVDTTNTTAAGIYQKVGNDGLAVAVDEFESRAGDNSTAKKLLELARQASSGGEGLRGGDKHTGHTFKIRSAFLFSSINAPPMEPQDLSRFALLRLHSLPKGQPPPDINPKILGDFGRIILRRLIDEWPRFPETLAAFKGELARIGMDGRGQDTFGTLLACGDLIEHRGWDEDRLRVAIDGDLVPWGDLLGQAGMAEFEDAVENWRLCLNHMLSTQVDAWKSGHRRTVGQVLVEWLSDVGDMNIGLAKTLLSQAGLALVNKRINQHSGWWLAVPNQNPLTRTLFDGSKWAGEISASIWSGALRQAPRGEIYEVGQVKVNGVNQRCTLIRINGLYGAGGIMDAAMDEPEGDDRG